MNRGLKASMLAAVVIIGTTIATTGPALAGPAPNQGGGPNPTGGVWYTPAGATAVGTNINDLITNLPPTRVIYPNPSAFSNASCALGMFTFASGDSFNIIGADGSVIGWITCSQSSWYGQLQA